ncbi:coiled-coil domain-containing protein 191 isoform X5 [Phacochoerus africanus]|uniref:coiled-coil domain-containing protein 191 isoform X5 n=1 Tax=Phacochoerus africanus TaxID=41426 RepID=UPI001FD9A171|nr:coiled-coil domain-containing protein 191 isoform X5 [Phacochoerus africanus]
MLLTPQERSSSKKGTGLNRWKQFTRKPSPTKPMFDPDNMEHWIKRVEKASEFAVSKAFSARNSNLSRRPWGQIIDLETPEQIEDPDEVYAEAQELVNDWLDTKLKQELASDGEGDAEDTELSSPPFPEFNGHLKYDKFDDLCGYLEEEEESTTVQKFIDHLLHKDVVDSGMLEDLGMNENQDKKQQKDPHLTMEMRHKQVKENRLRREKELERQKIEKTLKKSAFLEAHFLVQEEKKRKALEAKKEEEEIQREMVKLRREIIERRRTVEEAWKIKQQLAAEYNRKQVLRHHFTEWQHWHRAEILKRELAITKEETRKKMNELLKAALLGKLIATVSSSSNLLEATAMEDPSRNEEVAAVPPLWEKHPPGSKDYMPSPRLKNPAKCVLQVPLQNVPLDTTDDKPHKTLDLGPFQQPGNKKLKTSSQKAEPVRMGYFHNCHIFQQQLIEKQKKKLQEQQKTILELKKNQQLAEVPQAVGRGDARSCLLSNPREDEQERTCQPLSNSPVESPGTEHGRSESRNSLSGPRRNPRQLMAPHPILKAMEERAVQRAERRRILAERKKKQEEEKLAQLKAQEEERQKREAEEKEAKLEKKREEKRLKKMKELEKQERIKRNQQLDAIAKEHYKKVLLRKKGLEPWKRLRMQSKQNIQVAIEHHSLALQRKCLLTWFQWSQESLARKIAQADQFYYQILLRRVTQSWLQYLIDLEEEERKLCVHFLQKKVFRAWYNLVREAKIDSQNKHKIAVEHSDRRILQITFQTWRKFAKFTKEERGKEERREQLRRKVAEILPDFRMFTPL